MMDVREKSILDKLNDSQSLIEDIKAKQQVIRDMQKQIDEAVHIIDGKLADIVHNVIDCR